MLRKIKKKLSQIPLVRFLYYKVLMRVCTVLFPMRKSDEFNTSVMDIEVDTAIGKAQWLTRLKTRPNVLCTGRSAYLQMSDVLEGISLSRDDVNIVVMSHGDDENFFKECNPQVPFVPLEIPRVLTRDKILRFQDIELPEEIRKSVDSNEFLQKTAKAFMMRNYEVQENFAKYYVFKAQQYIEESLELINPAVVIMWNQFTPYHQIFTEVCRQHSIPILFCEYGVLPGTIAFEKGGQMGESYPSVHYKKFLEQPISEDEILAAEKIQNYLKESRLNRKKQPADTTREDILKKLKPDRPTIFFAGQNDPESGIIPYTEKSKKYHSPMFGSSDDAAKYLAELAINNNWNIIYKEHPFMEENNKAIKHIDGVVIVKKVDINEVIDIADVTITILSQAAYIALIREKPVVMLGYNQLKGKECCYEAFERDTIEREIKNALKSGQTKEQKYAFMKHIAQTVKYYLYDDNKPRDLRYGRETAKAVDFFNQEVPLFSDLEEYKAQQKKRLFSGDPLRAQTNAIASELQKDKYHHNSKKNLLFLAFSGGNNLMYISPLLSQLAKKDKDYQYVFVSTKKAWRMALKNRYLRGIEKPIALLTTNLMLWSEENASQRVVELAHTGEMSQHIENNQYCQHAVEGLMEGFRGISRETAEYYIFYIDKLTNILLDNLKPKGVLLWNKHHPYHYVADALCRKRGIKVLYGENGILPGTFNIEKEGQMGESWPAQSAKEFKKIPVSESEYEKAGRILEYHRLNKVNRKVQPTGNNAAEELRKQLKPGRPIILYAGQNDFESGIYPYDENSKKYHSPSFKSSDEAALFLAEISEKNDWNFIYKPHPITVSHARRLPEAEWNRCGMIYVETIDINEIIDMADLVVTILSQTAYVALTRRKPALMLGYNQLREKDCCYEAYSRDVIETKMMEAINCGLTEAQINNFQTHIAQICKAYLFSDLLEKEIDYGRNVNKCLAYIHDALTPDWLMKLKKVKRRIFG